MPSLPSDYAQREIANMASSQDTVPEQSAFVYKYITDDLLSLAREDLLIALSKRIIRDRLQRLAAVHNPNIGPTDVKANNILVERKEDHRGIFIEQVQLAEAHTQGCVDILSLGLVCIYAVLKQVIFAVNDDEPLSVALERQISYFADEDGLDRILNRLGDSPWCEVLEVIRDGLDITNPRKPFSLWKNVEADFKDLVGGLTDFDPAKRLTAHEALAHRWFRDV